MQILRGPEAAHGECRIEDVFERQAARGMDRIAIRHGGGGITYAVLDHVANALRDMIVGAAVVPGSLIAVVAERSPELVYGILAILKARCAYLPLDPNSPAERNRRILDDAGVEHILAFGAEAAALAGTKLTTSSVCDYGRLLRRRIAQRPAPHDPQLAYVMYTSGSTGMPKGAMVRHASVLRLVLQPNYVDLDERSRILHTGAPGFDASTFEIWGALLNGGMLVQMHGDTVLDPFEVERVLRAEHINVLFLTTPLFHRWENPAMFAPLEQLFVGGEVLSPEIAERVRRANPHLRMSNIYGPTENTTFSTFEPLTTPLEARPVPIGRPITGTYGLVFDEQKRLVPMGVPGELYLGGVGLAAGYLNQREATAQKFIDYKGERLYRTGDRVRILDGGSIEFLGRVDDQVKIRGHRVEPGEVEWHLTQHPRVKDGAVVYVPPAEGRHASGRLAACFVPMDEQMAADGSAVLEAFLRSKVPSAMVPQQYLLLERVPLNGNGKVDRAALRAIASKEGNAADRAVVGPQPLNEIERTVIAAWEQCLNRRQIDLEQNLYALGGDSLAAIQICAELNRRGFHLPVADLLRSPTVRGSSRHVIAVQPASKAEAGPCADYPLSAAQYRFLRRDLPNPHHFVVPLLLRLKRAVTADELSAAVEAALAGQDNHRVHFHRNARTGALRQVVRDWQRSDYFQAIDWSGEPAEHHRGRVAAHAAAICSSLDIWNGPLFRVTLFAGGAAPLLHLVFHHLIFDGVSLTLLLQRLRSQLAMPGSGVVGVRSYLQWCQTMERQFAERDAEAMRPFWENVLCGEDVSPTRPPHKDMRTQTALLLEGDEELAGFAQAVAELHTTPFTALVALFAIALHERGLAPRALHVQTSQRENDPALHDTMGYCSAALPFALPSAAECSALTPPLLRMLERHLAEILDRGRAYLALRYVLPELDPAGRPLKDACAVMFHYLGEDPLQETNDLFEPADIPAGRSIDPENPSNYLLNVTIIRRRGSMAAAFYYSPADYRSRDIDAIASAMRSQVRKLCGSGVPA
jgi:amino acid adenylation domain-containing protein